MKISISINLNDIKKWEDYNEKLEELQKADRLMLDILKEIKRKKDLLASENIE